MDPCGGTRSLAGRHLRDSRHRPRTGQLLPASLAVWRCGMVTRVLRLDQALSPPCHSVAGLPLATLQHHANSSSKTWCAEERLPLVDPDALPFSPVAVFQACTPADLYGCSSLESGANVGALVPRPQHAVSVWNASARPDQAGAGSCPAQRFPRRAKRSNILSSGGLQPGWQPAN